MQGAYAPVVQAHRTSSNLLEPHHCRDSKVFRVVSHMSSGWFEYTEPSLTIYIFTGETRCAGCFCTSSGWFKRIEPILNHIIAEIARSIEFFHMSSEWFDYTEPSLTIYIFTGETRCAGCLCTSSGWFKRIEPPRTFSNHIIAEIARFVELFHT